MATFNEYLDTLAELAVDQFRDNGLEAALDCLHRGLQTLLPVSKITCVFKGYNEHSLIRFAEVPAQAQLPLGRVELEGLLPQDVRQVLYDISGRNYVLINNIDEDTTLFTKQLKTMGYQEKSILQLSLLATSTYFFFLSFFSQEEGCFREHVETLINISSPLAEAMRAFFYAPLATNVSDTPSPAQAMDLIAMCPGLNQVRSMVDKVAPTKATVLLLGETGTGKEVVARAIHENSTVASGPFVKVNCGAIPESLLDSELFGYERGAFTGALQTKPGYFEQAQNGTLLLDEIGELAPMAQVRLLRVLETREIQRVGGVRPIPVKVRIVAATRRNLKTMVEEGTFREDLWYRLNLYPISLPPLRHRRGDIPRLVNFFLKAKAVELDVEPRQLALHEMSKLMARDWGGNVRELEYVLERALILAREDPKMPLCFEEYQDRDQPWDISERLSILFSQESMPTFDQLNAAYIRLVLHHTQGRIKGPGGAAEVLGLHPSTLRHRMDILGVEGKKQIKKAIP